MKKLSLCMLALVFVLAISGCGCEKNDVNGGNDALVLSDASEVSDVLKTDEASEIKEEKKTEKTEKKADKGEKKVVSDPIATTDVEKSNAPDAHKQVSDEAKEKLDSTKILYSPDKENGINLLYHTAGCKLLEGKEAMEVNSDFVTMIGLKACQECKPPKY